MLLIIHLKNLCFIESLSKGYLSTLLIIIIIWENYDTERLKWNETICDKNGFYNWKFGKDGTVKDKNLFNKIKIEDDCIRDRNGNIKIQFSGSNIFFGCSSFKNINLSYFNTQNITNMVWIFSAYSSLINIDII